MVILHIDEDFGIVDPRRFNQQKRELDMTSLLFESILLDEVLERQVLVRNTFDLRFSRHAFFSLIENVFCFWLDYDFGIEDVDAVPLLVDTNARIVLIDAHVLLFFNKNGRGNQHV